MYFPIHRAEGRGQWSLLGCGKSGQCLLVHSRVQMQGPHTHTPPSSGTYSIRTHRGAPHACSLAPVLHLIMAPSDPGVRREDISPSRLPPYIQSHSIHRTWERISDECPDPDRCYVIFVSAVLHKVQYVILARVASATFRLR